MHLPINASDTVSKCAKCHFIGVHAVAPKVHLHNGEVVDNRRRDVYHNQQNHGDEDQERADMVNESAETHRGVGARRAESSAFKSLFVE